jgi:hypothetical protein
MTLLLGVVFAFIVAFLVITIVLDIRLIGRPFCLRLFLVLSVLRTLVIIVGTGFALGSIELYLLQSVVIVVPGRDIPLNLSVSLTLEVITLLFYLYLENAGVNLDSEVCYALESR